MPSKGEKQLHMEGKKKKLECILVLFVDQDYLFLIKSDGFFKLIFWWMIHIKEDKRNLI